MVDTRFAVSVHIMAVLANSKDGTVTSPTLAGSIRTSPVVVRRLVGKLVLQGLVRSYRGKTGGLALARRPEDITLRDIYQAAQEKPLLALSEKPVTEACAVSCNIGTVLGGIVTGMEAASLDYLQQIRLSDFTEKILESSRKD